MSDTGTALVECPLCGGTDGYMLSKGDTYRWWLLFCAACGEQVTECAADRKAAVGAYPERWPAADEAWNSAGAHAQSLRDEVARHAQSRDEAARPSKWQPIATAPRDGTAILLSMDRDVTIGAYLQTGTEHPWEVFDVGSVGMLNGWRDDVDGPTHWMPLPAPPE